MLVTETFHGFIETTQDVLLVFEGCRRGLLPRICRRLQEKERKMIRSGSVFVFDERESGIKRWTDGRVWSPSRILGNFLIYRELDKRSAGDKRLSASSVGSAAAAAAAGDMRQRSFSLDHSASGLPSAPTGGGSIPAAAERTRERHLVGSLSDSYKFRKDGLIKKTMSIVVNGVSQHLISYYHPQDVLHGKLRTPSSVPELASLEISPDLLVKQNFRIPPMVEPTFEPVDPSASTSSPLTGAPLTPPESVSGSYGDRRMHHPLRSMSVGSLRGPDGMPQQSMPSHFMYHPPYHRVEMEHKQPMYGGSTQPMPMPNMTGTAYPGMSSPSSMASSPSTPMLSPGRPTFQHQRHYSTSSMTSNTLPRFDGRSYSQQDMMMPHPTHMPQPPSQQHSPHPPPPPHQQHQPSQAHSALPPPPMQPHDALGSVHHPHIMPDFYNSSHGDRGDGRHPLQPEDPSTSGQLQRYNASNPNLGQLLNPVHPLSLSRFPYAIEEIPDF